MTLNANYSGATLMAGRRKLEGPDRGLDVLIGLVIVIVEVLIGVLSIVALYDFGRAFGASNPDAQAGVNDGFGIAIVGSAIAFGLTTLIYLVRIIAGRRSWRAPLWGLILMTVVLIFGYLIMGSGSSL